MLGKYAAEFVTGVLAASIAMKKQLFGVKTILQGHFHSIIRFTSSQCAKRIFTVRPWRTVNEFVCAFIRFNAYKLSGIAKLGHVKHVPLKAQHPGDTKQDAQSYAEPKRYSDRLVHGPSARIVL